MIVDALRELDVTRVAVIVPVVALAVFVVPYFSDPHRIRSNGINGPFWAQFTDAWLGLVAAQGHRSEVVHEEHKKYGRSFALFFTSVALAVPMICESIRECITSARNASLWMEFLTYHNSRYFHESSPESCLYQ